MIAYGKVLVSQTLLIAAFFGLALAATCGSVTAQDQPTGEQILKSLKSRGPARGAHGSAAEQEQSEERRFIQALLKKNPRTITVEKRRKVADIVDQKPSIDL